MTSSINPNTIDTAYPVAGQDNSTQGFRDNFAAIKQNFEYAEEEITSLQNVVAVVDSDNGFGDNLIYAARVKDIAAVKVTYPSATGALNLSFAEASYFSLVTAGSVNLTFSDWPSAPSSSVGVIRVRIQITNTAHTMTVSANNTGGGGVLIDVAGIQGYAAVNAYSGTVTFAAVGYYEFDFVSSNGGSAITVRQLNQSLVPFNASSQDLANGAAVNMAVTTSYFSTAGVETATLAAGVNGQIKVFVMAGWAGNMVITVANAGWGGAGTMTFNAAGKSATLLYTNNSWFCIANNGTTFA
jgi:hypothetical protein